MRIAVAVADVDGAEVPWQQLHGPGRALVYQALAAKSAEMAQLLHDTGSSGSGMKPIGVDLPRFSGRPRDPARYTTGPAGGLTVGSPVPELAAALLVGLSTLVGERMRWGR